MHRIQQRAHPPPVQQPPLMFVCDWGRLKQPVFALTRGGRSLDKGDGHQVDKNRPQMKVCSNLDCFWPFLALSATIGHFWPLLADFGHFCPFFLPTLATLGRLSQSHTLTLILIIWVICIHFKSCWLFSQNFLAFLGSWWASQQTTSSLDRGGSSKCFVNRLLKLGSPMPRGRWANLLGGWFPPYKRDQSPVPSFHCRIF